MMFLSLSLSLSLCVCVYQEPFVAECVQLLVSRAPKPLGPGTDRCGLTQDVVITILACLQPCIGSVERHTNTVALLGLKRYCFIG